MNLQKSKLEEKPVVCQVEGALTHFPSALRFTCKSLPNDLRVCLEEAKERLYSLLTTGLLSLRANSA